jgi:hypothetical protein
MARQIIKSGLTEAQHDALDHTGLTGIPSISGLLDETAHDGLDHSGLTGIPTLPNTAIILIAIASATDVSVADGVMYFPIPPKLNGKILKSANAIVNTAGSTNATTIDIYNVTDSVDMLSSAISIASDATVGTAGTVNTSYDDVATNDVLRVDITSASSTKPKGLMVMLEFGV